MELEMLRFITFEAPEMTHTCCRGGFISAPCPHHIAITVLGFDGDFDEIRQEEDELAASIKAFVE